MHVDMRHEQRRIEEQKLFTLRLQVVHCKIMVVVTPDATPILRPSLVVIGNCIHDLVCARKAQPMVANALFRPSSWRMWCRI
jgi:hypothetical protein